MSNDTTAHIDGSPEPCSTIPQIQAGQILTINHNSAATCLVRSDWMMKGIPLEGDVALPMTLFRGRNRDAESHSFTKAQFRQQDGPNASSNRKSIRPTNTFCHQSWNVKSTRKLELAESTREVLGDGARGRVGSSTGQPGLQSDSFSTGQIQRCPRSIRQKPRT